jgi:hypothetical protein
MEIVAETTSKAAYSRVCLSPFPYLKAQSKDRFRYAAAERTLNPLAG